MKFRSKTLVSISIFAAFSAANVAYAATSKEILEAYYNSSASLAKLMGCELLLTPKNTHISPDDRNIFIEEDVEQDIVFLATNDDFYKISSIVVEKEGKTITVNGYLFKTEQVEDPKEIDLFELLDRSAAKSKLVSSPSEFKDYVKVAQLLKADEVEIKIEVENFTPQQIANFLKSIVEKLKN